LKVKFDDFKQITRSKTSANVIASLEELERISSALLYAMFPTAKGIRLLGIALSSFAEEAPTFAKQLPLFV
jgi:DNA polymerase-4